MMKKKVHLQPHSYYRLGESMQVFCNTCMGTRPASGIHYLAQITKLEEYGVKL